MARYTNIANLPAPLVAAITYSDYDGESYDITASGLVTPPRIRQLMKRHSKEITEDVSDRIWALIGSVGHATYGHTAVAKWFDPRRHRRAVIFTDDQQHDAGQVRLDHVPVIYTFNLAGYAPSALPAGQRGRYTLGGFTDATFTAMKVLEEGGNDVWPF